MQISKKQAILPSVAVIIGISLALISFVNYNQIDANDAQTTCPECENNYFSKDGKDLSVFDNDEKLPVKMITTTNIDENSDDISGELSKLGEPYWPKYTLTFPEEVRFGEPFDVVLDYSFIIPSIDDDEFGVEFLSYDDPEMVCVEEECGDREVWIGRPSEVELLNRPEYVFDNAGVVTMENELLRSEVGRMHPQFNNTGPQQEIFTFVINEPSHSYKYGDVEVSFLQEGSKFHYYMAPDRAIYLSEDPIYMPGEGPQHQLHDYREPIMISNVDPNSPPTYDELAVFLVREFPIIADNYEGYVQRQPTLDDGYFTGFFNAYPEFAGDAPYKDGFLEKYAALFASDEFLDSQPVTYDDPPDWYMPELAKDFQNNHPNDFDVEKYLVESNISPEFIERFFEQYPDLRVQHIFPFANFLLPQAFGTGNESTIIGNLKYERPDGKTSFLSGVQVCLYDEEYLTTLTPIADSSGNLLCAITSDNGVFTISNVPRSDPYGNGGADVVTVVSVDTDSVVVYKNNNQNVHRVIADNTKYDINANFVNLGIVTLRASQDSLKALWTLQELESIDAWYGTNVNYNPPKTHVYWDPTSCGGVGVGPKSKTLTLEDTSRIFNSRTYDCANSVISPLTNVDTLSHEFAHIQFYRQYDSRNSDYPPYELREHDGVVMHSPVHASPPGTAWVEGWAFFMATAYSGSPTYQPTYMNGQWNFETRTNTETTDKKFAGKSFVPGFTGEGSVAAALYDLIDTTNEHGDNQQDQLRSIWNVMNDNLEFDENIIAADFGEFKNDWDDEKLPTTHLKTLQYIKNDAILTNAR